MNTARSLDAYDLDARFTLTPRGVEYLAARAPLAPCDDPYTSAEALRALAELAAPTHPAECECERAEDGAAFVCAACRALDDDGRDEPAAGAEYAGAEYAPAPLTDPLDEADVIPFP